MQHDGQINAAYNKSNNSYEYEDGFKYVKPIIQQYDIAIANLEVTLAGKPYKGYPQFSAPDELAKTLINSGFNLILTANNHSCDRGSKGVLRTLDVLDRLGVMHTGTFRSKEERDKNYPLIIEQKGMKVAILNYTYGTNGLTVNKPLIINYIDSAVIRKDVEKAKKLNADYVICNMHWGKEYKSLPDSYEKKWEAYCYRIGIDMVIGGHPHVVQPIVKKELNGKEKLTAWSLGNFVSNMSIRYTRGGVMVGVKVKKENNTTKLSAVEYCLVYVHKKQEGAVKQYYILPEFDYNSYRPGFLDPGELSRMNQFFSDSRKLFRDHNKGNSEKIIDADSEIGILFQKYLRGYYSVMIPDGNNDLLMNSALKKYVHTTVDAKGNRYLLSGKFETMKEAHGNLKFIEDCNISEQPKIVLVNSKGVVIKDVVILEE
jgi:poly-gamma-glutamate synthesis protein (capsule biosynthesis protein)